MNKTPDFIAELHHHTAVEGGRSTPAFSGYRPHIKFSFSEFLTSGQQKFLNKEIVYPGDNVTAEIAIASVEFFKGKLKKDMLFDFREGTRIIGTGKIIEVLNEELLAK